MNLAGSPIITQHNIEYQKVLQRRYQNRIRRQWEYSMLQVSIVNQQLQRKNQIEFLRSVKRQQSILANANISRQTINILHCYIDVLDQDIFQFYIPLPVDESCQPNYQKFRDRFIQELRIDPSVRFFNRVMDGLMQNSLGLQRNEHYFRASRHCESEPDYSELPEVAKPQQPLTSGSVQRKKLNRRETERKFQQLQAQNDVFVCKRFGSLIEQQTGDQQVNAEEVAPNPEISEEQSQQETLNKANYLARNAAKYSGKFREQYFPQFVVGFQGAKTAKRPKSAVKKRKSNRPKKLHCSEDQPAIELQTSQDQAEKCQGSSQDLKEIGGEGASDVADRQEALKVQNGSQNDKIAEQLTQMVKDRIQKYGASANSSDLSQHQSVQTDLISAIQASQLLHRNVFLQASALIPQSGMLTAISLSDINYQTVASTSRRKYQSYLIESQKRNSQLKSEFITQKIEENEVQVVLRKPIILEDFAE